MTSDRTRKRKKAGANCEASFSSGGYVSWAVCVVVLVVISETVSGFSRCKFLDYFLHFCFRIILIFLSFFVTCFMIGTFYEKVSLVLSSSGLPYTCRIHLPIISRFGYYRIYSHIHHFDDVVRNLLIHPFDGIASFSS
jgi:uncharacterized membrane protein required for colicin V production